MNSFNSNNDLEHSKNINSHFVDPKKLLEESKVDPSSPSDPFMYLNSMGGRHAAPVTEKRRASLNRKKSIRSRYANDESNSQAS